MGESPKPSPTYSNPLTERTVMASAAAGRDLMNEGGGRRKGRKGSRKGRKGGRY